MIQDKNIISQAGFSYKLPEHIASILIADTEVEEQFKELINTNLTVVCPKFTVGVWQGVATVEFNNETFVEAVKRTIEEFEQNLDVNSLPQDQLQLDDK
ncbi:MAG: hypothetical protein R3B92_02510 [Patescibacteria group bacterium]|uniref:Uncharacterized protein n=1 Tax=candidate division WWE3 bacterium TaxID=2053526 RepID=A0A955EDC5_UNCKA|nr:hypothetical protein [candidate division WWE3 bacterium]